MQREPRKRRAKEPLAEPKARKTATTKKNATAKKTTANAASGVGEDVLALIIIELKKWRLFDPSSLCALAFTSKRIRAGLPFHDIVREATVPRLIERRRCALRQAYLNKHYFGVADDGKVWWKNAEYDREAAALEATPCTDADVLAYCQLSTPDWLHAFQNMHSRYQLTYLGDQHQLLVSYMCTFEMLIAHLRRHLFFDRTPKLSINGTMPRKDAIVAQVLKQQRDGTISIVCPDFGHPHMFDLHLTKAPMTLMPGEDAVIERHLPIAHPPAHVNTETSSVEAWFPYLSKFISNGGQVSIGRQAHHHMMVLSGERIVHRHFKHMGSLQRYLESADQHCRRYFESAEDEYDPYADEDEDDEDADDEETATTDGVPSYNDGVSPSIPDTESECMVDGSRSFNADVVFPHLSKYISAKGWQSIELNVFGSRYATVHKGVQSNSIMAIAITHPPSTSLDHMLTELNACVAPGPLKARTDAIKKRKQQQELIPAHLKYRRFLFYMKHAQILQQGQVFSISARHNMYVNAMVGDDIFAPSSPNSIVVQFELTFPQVDQYENSQVVSLGLVEPSEYPKTRVSARFVDTNLDFPVLCWRNGLEFLVGRETMYPTNDDGHRNFMLRYEKSPFKSGDTVSLLFNRQEGTVQFAHNQQLQPFYFTGVKCNNFYETGLMVFVTLERPNVQVRSLDAPNMKFLPPTGQRVYYNFDQYDF